MEVRGRVGANLREEGSGREEVTAEDAAVGDVVVVSVSMERARSRAIARTGRCRAKSWGAPMVETARLVLYLPRRLVL